MLETITTKKCSTCKTIRPLSEFYRSSRTKDGYRWQCKKCSRMARLVWYWEENGKKWLQNRKQSPTGKISNSQDGKRWKARWPQKVKAHHAVAHAVITGHLLAVRTLLCIHCLNPATQYHHSHGYSDAHKLDVVPVCDHCHRLIHSLPS